jgi:hypothetical protein
MIMKQHTSPSWVVRLSRY